MNDVGIVWRGRGHVNCWALLWLMLSGCSYKLGRPPVVGGRYHVSGVVTPVAEPGVGDALSRRLAMALSSRGALGGELGVMLTVSAATFAPVASSDTARVARVSLVFDVEVDGRKARFSGQQPVSVSAPLETAEARAQAFDALAAVLAEDASDWIVRGPEVR